MRVVWVGCVHRSGKRRETGEEIILYHRPATLLLRLLPPTLPFLSRPFPSPAFPFGVLPITVLPAPIHAVLALRSPFLQDLKFELFREVFYLRTEAHLDGRDGLHLELYRDSESMRGERRASRDERRDAEERR